MALTVFQYLDSPLGWLVLGAGAIGISPVMMISFISLQCYVLDTDVLMLIGVHTTGADAISLGDYLEAGWIIFLFTLADWLEPRSNDKARMAILSVASLVPQVTFLVVLGSRLSVKYGPIVGVVVCAVDESSLSCESMLVDIEAETTVWTGTLNMPGYLCILTIDSSEESVISRMVRLVEDAQTQHSNVEQLQEKYYTPGTLTRGHLQVSEVHAMSNNTDFPKLLYWVACIESQSNHPMASSLVLYTKVHGSAVKDFTLLAGGVNGVIDRQIGCPLGPQDGVDESFLRHNMLDCMPQHDVGD